MGLRFSAVLVILSLNAFSNADALSEEVPTLPYSYHLAPNKEHLPLEHWQIGRVFRVSNEAPLARLLQTQPEAVYGATELLKFFKHSEKKMNQLQRSASAPNASLAERRRVCNVPCCYPRYYDARVVLSRARYGILPDKHCVTELEDDGSRHLMNAIASFTRGVNKVAMNISNALLGNWTYAEAHSRFTYNTSFHSCAMERMSGTRVDGYWSILSGITNAPGLKKLPEWGRHYYLEDLVLRPDGRLDAFPGYAPKRSGAEDTMVNTTTKYQMWGANMDTSSFGQAPIEHNYAIRAALEMSEILRAQAEDSTTPSNILILLFPLTMVFVPIGLFADVGHWATLSYALVTDVMTTLPLLIKGVELLLFASQSHAATRAFIYGMQGPKALGCLEVWAAECTAGDKMKNIGISFILAAIFGMAIGVGLEIMMCTRVQRKRKKVKVENEDEEAKFGEIEYLWQRSIHPCDECLCDRMLRDKWIDY